MCHKIPGMEGFNAYAANLWFAIAYAGQYMCPEFSQICVASVLHPDLWKASDTKANTFGFEFYLCGDGVSYPQIFALSTYSVNRLLWQTIFTLLCTNAQCHIKYHHIWLF